MHDDDDDDDDDDDSGHRLKNAWTLQRNHDLT